jgi:hypothetical protein
MEWQQAKDVEWLEARLPRGRAAFSTRSAGSVKESLTPLAAALGLRADRIATGRQVHGAKLAFHEAMPSEEIEVDGHVVTAPGLAALVFAADCLPIALSGPGGVAVLHCGWRGLAAGIVARGVAAVGADAAAIGPGIGPCCYEVGPEVLDAFAGLGPGLAEGRMLDLGEVARRLLGAAGVEQIEAAGLCTSCEAQRFFSHRREPGGAGRQAGVVWLESSIGKGG